MQIRQNAERRERGTRREGCEGRKGAPRRTVADSCSPEAYLVAASGLKEASVVERSARRRRKMGQQQRKRRGKCFVISTRTTGRTSDGSGATSGGSGLSHDCVGLKGGGKWGGEEGVRGV